MSIVGYRVKIPVLIGVLLTLFGLAGCGATDEAGQGDRFDEETEEVSQAMPSGSSSSGGPQNTNPFGWGSPCDEWSKVPLTPNPSKMAYSFGDGAGQYFAGMDYPNPGTGESVGAIARVAVDNSQAVVEEPFAEVTRFHSIAIDPATSEPAALGFLQDGTVGLYQAAGGVWYYAAPLGDDAAEICYTQKHLYVLSRGLYAGVVDLVQMDPETLQTQMVYHLGQGVAYSSYSTFATQHYLECFGHKVTVLWVKDLSVWNYHLSVLDESTMTVKVNDLPQQVCPWQVAPGASQDKWLVGGGFYRMVIGPIGGGWANANTSVSHVHQLTRSADGILYGLGWNGGSESLVASAGLAAGGSWGQPLPTYSSLLWEGSNGSMYIAASVHQPGAPQYPMHMYACDRPKK
ncbi:hypothetical protein KBD18_02025 [Patescibacteria group bacterium]|nr:hypothetical protein [Patescibacteria group bacterium]